jgi:uncharacterized protein (DUF885 family)
MLGYALVALGAGAASFVGPTVWGKPWSVHHLYTRTLVERVWESPQICSSLHLLDWRKERLDDLSPAHNRKVHDLLQRELDTLHRYDRAAMSETEQTSFDVMEWFLASELDRDSNGGPYVINQLDGLHSAFPDFMLHQHEVRSRADAEAYVARLRAFGAQVDQALESAQADAARGIVPPRFVLARVEADARAYAAKPTADDPLVKNLDAKLKDLKDVDDRARVDLVARAAKAVDDVVKPAYARYVAATVALEPQATDDGMWHQPGGAERYAKSLRRETASELPPDQVHAMGLAEVASIEEQMRAVLGKLGLPTESPTDAVRALKGDPRFRYPATPEGRAMILADYQKMLDDVGAHLDKFIARPFHAPVKVEPVPAFQEASQPGGHYEQPPLDESRPGTFFANLAIPQIKFQMRTLAYHEGMPGHHLQIVTAQHLTDLPMFRQLVPFNSYIEGWALWSEQIAAEQGFEEDPYDRLGYLSSMLFRAARLVVDTGIHAERWSKDEAVAFYRTHTVSSDENTEIEINRYFVWPGQACGYMVGKKTIEALAVEAKGALGDRFSLPEFDDVVLGAGAVPMPILQRVVRRWIGAASASGARRGG